MPDLCLLVCTYRPEQYAFREPLINRCLTSVAALKKRYGGRIYTIIWDNCSTPRFRDELRALDWPDRLVFSTSNLYDYGAIHALSEFAKDLASPFVIYLNDDIEFYKFEFLDDCLALLSRQSNSGCIRLNRFDFNQLHIYDKDSRDPLRDSANCARLYNWVTKEPVHHKLISASGLFEFYRTNFHWTLFPTISRTQVLNDICPYRDYRPLQSLEGYMMNQYNNLGLDTLVLNGGVCEHLAAPSNSMRLRKRTHPIILWDSCLKIIDTNR